MKLPLAVEVFPGLVQIDAGDRFAWRQSRTFSGTSSNFTASLVNSGGRSGSPHPWKPEDEPAEGPSPTGFVLGCGMHGMSGQSGGRALVFR